jgi:hypothetical protein
MRRAATHPPGKRHDGAGGRVERDIIGVLLVLMAVAVSWWAGTWWRAAHAGAATARPPRLDTAVPTAPPRFDRLRAQALLMAGLPRSVVDAGVEPAPATHARPRPGPGSYGIEQGHGSDRWGHGDSPERQDFEPRYSPDAGTFAELPPAAAQAPRAFH